MIIKNDVTSYKNGLYLKKNIMKFLQFKKSRLLIPLFSIIFSFAVNAQVNGWKPELVKNSKEALNKMLKTTPKLKVFYNKAYGYAVFPRITKAGIGIGGAVGRGTVFKNHYVIGSANLKQASIGFQFGGQQYSEVIFFKNKKSFENFINGNLKFNAQASAVALKEGASIDVAYHKNVAVFTKTEGGLMYEASIGGQYFKFKPIKE